MILWNFFNMYVFEVKESIAGIPTELPCSGYLGKSRSTFGTEVIEGADDCVL